MQEAAMPITTLSSRELNQDIGRAKRAARLGPVFITDRGRLSHVLLSVDDYEKLTGSRRSIVEALSMPGVSDIAFEPTPVRIGNRDPDLS